MKSFLSSIFLLLLAACSSDSRVQRQTQSRAFAEKQLGKTLPELIEAMKMSPADQDPNGQRAYFFLYNGSETELQADAKLFSFIFTNGRLVKIEGPVNTKSH